MPFNLTRRQFGVAAAATVIGTSLPRSAFAQATTRTVETALGSYDIPLAPKRVVCIDHRIDYEPALVLGLPVVGHTEWLGRPWVPEMPGATLLVNPPVIEAVLALEPDLIICTDEDPDGEWWPARRLREIAPVLPTGFNHPWKSDLLQLADWLDRRPAAEAAIAEYDALIADIRTRHASALGTLKIAAVHYITSINSLYITAPSTRDYMGVKSNVLQDLGSLTVSPEIVGDEGELSLENVPMALGDVDVLFVNDYGNGGLAELAEIPVWQRLPAVAAGRVVEMKGNANSGSFYTARYIAQQFDALYQRFA